MSKARVYLYDKQRIIQKVVMLDENGNEDESLPYVINYGFLADSIIFGTEKKIEFFLHPMGITLYESKINELEFINNSDSTYFIKYNKNIKNIKPHNHYVLKLR